jgi:hypothetical protein
MHSVRSTEQNLYKAGVYIVYSTYSELELISGICAYSCIHSIHDLYHSVRYTIVH